MSDELSTVAGEPRLCECGCGIELDERPNRHYVNSAHRKAAWRQRTGYHVVGRQDRQKASQRRKSSRSGRQISYRKAVRMVTDLLSRPCSQCGACLLSPERAAERHVHSYLPEKQR